MTEREESLEAVEGRPAEDKGGSQFSRAFSEDGKLKTHVGGQALIEGIMMRGKYNWAVAVRKPDGSIHVEEHDLATGKPRRRWMSLPLIRGVTALVESLALGFKALEIAAVHALGIDEAENKAEEEEEGVGKGAMTVSMILGILMGIALFMVLPAFVSNLIVGDYDNNPVLWNILDGLVRVGLFLSYIWIIGRMEDIRRMFMYHGAEHKTIHCYEHGLPLTPENAMSFPRLHVRCGTAFLIMVLVIAIVVYTVIPVSAIVEALGVPDGLPKLALIIVLRVLFLPVIAAVSYEITVKWAGSHPDNPIVKVILWPGMQMQYLTTNEPDEGTLECAIAAMKRVLERERLEAVNAA